MKRTKRTKQCSSCREFKALKDFAKRSRGVWGRQGACLTCKRTYAKKHYVDNKTYYVEKARRWSEAHYAIVGAYILEQKLKPCTDCKRSFHPYAMDFDHCRGKKLFEISAVYTDLRRLQDVKTEIKKCDLVCACCHRIRTFNRSKELKNRFRSLMEQAPLSESGFMQVRVLSEAPKTSRRSLRSSHRHRH